MRPFTRFTSRLALGIVVPATLAASAHATTAPMLDERAPEFRLPGLDASPFDLSDSLGKIVVLHFATSWCPFCNAEAPHLEKLWQEYRERGVQVVTIDVRESREVTKTFADRWGFSFPTLLDADGSVTASYAPDGVLPDLPRADVPIAANLVIDGSGKIRFYSLLDTAAFDARLTAVRAKVEELLAERTGAESSAAADADFGCGPAATVAVTCR